MNIVKSALGHYEASGNADDADIVIGHSFGTSIGEGSVNRAIVDYILARANERPIVVDRMLVNEFPKGESQVDLIVDGPITNTIGQGVGTWGVLVEAVPFMKEKGLKLAMMVAQAHHIGRVAMQADKLGISYVVPSDLPDEFDTGSEQVFVRKAAFWVPREVLGSLVLRAQGKL
jgi:hypothetical protein